MSILNVNLFDTRKHVYLLSMLSLEESKKRKCGLSLSAEYKTRFVCIYTLSHNLRVNIHIYLIYKKLCPMLQKHYCYENI
jgi:hypothetical protein